MPTPLVDKGYDARQVLNYALDEINSLLRTNATLSGSVSVSGLSKEIKITTIKITDVAQIIPATAITDRNAICIQNKSATITVYVGPSTVTADTVVGTTSGWEIPPGWQQGFDIKDSIGLYAIVPTGEEAIVKVMELA